MDKVVACPKARRPLPAVEFDTSKIKAAMPSGATVRGVLAWLWLVIRLPIFFLMYWLRLPVIFVCNLVSIPLLLACLFSWYAFPDKTAMHWGFGIVSLSAFIFAWAYDFVLMAISPQDMVKSL